MRSRLVLVVVATTTVVLSGCGAASSPAPRSTLETPALTATPSAVVVSPSPSGLTVTLQPTERSPLEAADVGSLISTPNGMVALGHEYKADGTTPSFLVSGSADASRWTRLVDPGGQGFDAMADNQSGWVAATSHNDGPTPSTILWFSTDGESWAAVPPTDGIDGANLQGLSSESPITAGPAGFAIVGTKPEAGNSVADVWFSRDGRTWNEATVLKGRGFDQVLVLPNGFVAIASGCCGGPRVAAFSTDGFTWRDLSLDTSPSLDTADAGEAIVGATGSTLVAFRGGAAGDVEVMTGDLTDGAAQGNLAWQHQTAADETFAGAGVSAFTAGTDGLVAIGFDRTTLDPIAWTSTDAKTWRRADLDAATFGGGVPHLVAMSGATGSKSIAAVGYRVNDAGDTRPQLWISVDGAVWSETGGDLLGVPPVAPTGPCPAIAPTAVEDFLTMAPALWPLCFGHQALRIQGVTVNCECGGTTSELASPAWLIDPLGYSDVYLVPRVMPADTGIGGLTIKIDPANPFVVPMAGTYVELTGHFADPAAATCRTYPGLFGPVAPKGSVVALCNRTFVATGIRTLEG